MPGVWNSGGYERAETVRRLEGHVDVYLPDLKYRWQKAAERYSRCLLYTSDAADDPLCVDPGGRCIIKKKTTNR